MAYNNDLERAGVPSLTLGACRNADYESETLDFHQLDLTGADLIFQISEHPDPNAPLASCVVSHQTETKPYQDYIDACRFEPAWIACGENAADYMTSSAVTISSAKSTFTNLPRAAVKGEAVTLYYALRQTTPTEAVLLAGQFILTETA